MPRAPGAWDPGPHDNPFLPIRHNYIEGTKVLAAYLHEVSLLKD